MKNFCQALLVGVVLAASCIPALAQYGGGMGGMGGGMGRSRSRSGDMAGSPSGNGTVATPTSRANQIADRLYDLRMRLLITPEQGPAWEDFYAKATAWSSESFKGRMAASDQSATQAMQQRLGEAQNRYALMEALNDAVKKLYATLTPDQQRTADQYLPPAIP